MKGLLVLATMLSVCRAESVHGQEWTPVTDPAGRYAFQSLGPFNKVMGWAVVVPDADGFTLFGLWRYEPARPIKTDRDSVFGSWFESPLSVLKDGRLGAQFFGQSFEGGFKTDSAFVLKGEPDARLSTLSLGFVAYPDEPSGVSGVYAVRGNTGETLWHGSVGFIKSDIYRRDNEYLAGVIIDLESSQSQRLQVQNMASILADGSFRAFEITTTNDTTRIYGNVRAGRITLTVDRTLPGTGFLQRTEIHGSRQ